VGFETIVAAAGTEIRVCDPSGSPVGGPATPHVGPVTSLAAGRLGGRDVFASGGADGTVRIWPAGTDPAGDGSAGAASAGHTGPVVALAIARFGGRNLVAPRVRTARSGGGIRPAETATCWISWPGHVVQTGSVRRLSEDEFRATFDAHAVAVGRDDEPLFDFWPYFDAIPNEDRDGHDFSEGSVTHAWTMPISNYQHVLVRCDTPNVFLVMVLDLPRRQVYGHHLLDLRKLYGLA
jgi:WD40 repeat protein